MPYLRYPPVEGLGAKITVTVQVYDLKTEEPSCCKPEEPAIYFHTKVFSSTLVEEQNKATNSLSDLLVGMPTSSLYMGRDSFHSLLKCG